MANKMLIDATHPEETRVVVVRGNRVEDFDFEAASRRQLRGNIYLAKVTRVEPSLQAAFIDYGGNRHGFLAFSEIHPDYYQIPVADRQALIEAEQREADEADAAHAAEAAAEARRAREEAARDAAEEKAEQAAAGEDGNVASAPEEGGDDGHAGEGEDQVESVGSEDALEEVPERRRGRPRQYKIQEVIKRRQVLLVQVVKEERGTKGAALTTYLSLAGRYSVLMPNTSRGGGISRKITSAVDRKRLKDVVGELEVPEGMGVILRTAGASRTKAEVKRDFEYLLRLWESVREYTLKSIAPTLVYEEGSLIKRSIRDLYNKDIEEILVAGEDGYREAKDFMRMLMPSHARNVQPYRESQPVFARFGVEAQLDAMFLPQVTLRSGGYIVLNQTEALVAIDVNSGRSTREHNIEDTAFQTNLEAAEEVSRQLRLRDLAGLIVIDFIDMEEKRNNRAVERRMKESLKNDRARIQVGRISHFGLLEMSRQRIRAGVLESTMEVCQHCNGIGRVRSPSSVALHVLRSLEDHLLKGVTHNLIVRTRTPIALYILNQKRAHLSELEQRFGLTIIVHADESLTGGGGHFAMERGEPVGPRPLLPSTIQPTSVQPRAYDDEDEPAPEPAVAEGEEEIVFESLIEEVDQDEGDSGESANGENGGRRRRRRRRRRGSESNGNGAAHPEHAGGEDEPVATGGSDGDDTFIEEVFAGEAASESPEGEAGERGGDDEPRRRRRGRRGGRRARREDRPESGETPGADAPMMTADEDGEAEALETVVGQSYEIAAAIDMDSATPPDADEAPMAAITTADAAEPSWLPAFEAAAALPPAEEPPPPAPPPARVRPEPTPIDENRPKRGGWWQRRSFF